MTEHEQKVMKLVAEAAIYVPFNCEGIRIEYRDVNDKDDDNEGAFFGTGEESGDNYKVSFADVNLETDMFYKLVLMEA